MPLQNIENGKEFSNEMKESFRKFEDLVGRRLPEKVEVELEKVIIESFDNEKYKDKGTSKWDDRKEEDPGRKLLIGKGSGKLRRSIEVSHTKTTIKASTDVVYAPVHNEGLRAGRGRGFNMPQRQFMPKPGEANDELDAKVEKWLDNEMDKIFD
ncbi:phage virion morphogenesis protein [Ohtaekwangia kribbensis]|uniref:Phage virion morphogenesis protein n=1 Tax=Ohtaekwangia kribbensis TaxID=688913 RepID=A0ABW3JUT4_9BACT